MRTPGATVRLLDGARRPGAKILVSGGARCNVTNVAVSDADFWGGRRPMIRRVIRAFPGPRHHQVSFTSIGVGLHEEADGKLFPDSQRARDVLDALLERNRADRRRRLLPTRECSTSSATATDSASSRTAADIRAGRVVLATGGQSLPKSGSDGAGFEIARRLGHTIVPTTPALVPLLLPGGAERDASGAFRRGAAGRADAEGGRRRVNPPDRVAAVDAFRHQRAGDAGHVAPLASRSTRGSARARSPPASALAGRSRRSMRGGRRVPPNGRGRRTC